MYITKKAGQEICLIAQKSYDGAANLMVSLCIHLELADVIANVSTLKYVIT